MVFMLQWKKTREAEQETINIIKDIVGRYHVKGFYTDSGLSYKSRRKGMTELGVIETETDKITFLTKQTYTNVYELYGWGHYSPLTKTTYYYDITNDALYKIRKGKFVDGYKPAIRLREKKVFLSYVKNLENFKKEG
ncbi:hypothetical protein 000TH008_43 [Bacillus phage 000TH008]|nr:hypothetical protein 000TH008_43 [Bacillus phage 000TH008]QQO40737.1 hypothetical protein 000TH009_43 [Bacillus phage 000TH009]